MGAAFWIKRYLLAALPLFCILAAVEWFKGSVQLRDYLSAAAWAVVAAGIFVGSAYRRYKKGTSCAVCDHVGKPGKH